MSGARVGRPRIGELFAGYGGLGMGVQSVFGGDIAWVSDIDTGANKILAHRFPNVPNHGDITTIDWSTVEPVDILTGGSPCQDLSHAGKRQGMTEGTRSNLWVAMREAIAQLRPSLVIWENVRGAYSAEADSSLEFCEGCMGDAWYRGTVLRALGRVLGDLSDLGYDAIWHGLRASDVGACHGRFRVFLAAYPVGGGFPGWASDALGRQVGRAAAAGRGEDAGESLTLLPTPVADNSRGLPSSTTDYLSLPNAVCALLPTPRATDGTKGGPNQRGSSGDLMLPSAVNLLPTPAVNDMGEGKTVEAWDEWTAKMKAAHGNGNGHGASLAIEAQRLLPTPRASDGPDATSHGRTWSSTDNNLHNVARAQDWGQYAAAIHRWESITRPAPAPTELGAKGQPRLSARFSEWMMGLPDGWITDVPGITRNEALKAAGNGVVPQQAAAALRFMLAHLATGVAA